MRAYRIKTVETHEVVYELEADSVSEAQAILNAEPWHADVTVMDDELVDRDVISIEEALG